MYYGLQRGWRGDLASVETVLMCHYDEDESSIPFLFRIIFAPRCCRLEGPLLTVPKSVSSMCYTPSTKGVAMPIFTGGLGQV